MEDQLTGIVFQLVTNGAETWWKRLLKLLKDCRMGAGGTAISSRNCVVCNQEIKDGFSNYSRIENEHVNRTNNTKDANINNSIIIIAKIVLKITLKREYIVTGFGWREPVSGAF